jgi:hypothetical protein
MEVKNPQAFTSGAQSALDSAKIRTLHDSPKTDIRNKVIHGSHAL